MVEKIYSDGKKAGKELRETNYLPGTRVIRERGGEVLQDTYEKIN